MHANKPLYWSGALFAITAIAASGCATTSVQTDHDPRVDLPAYHTFEVKTGQVVDNGVVDKRDTLVTDRVDRALTVNLNAKGLQPTKENPELIATYTAGARTVAEIDDAWDGVGYGGYGAWVDEYTEGTLIIDLIDAKTKKLVWRSIVEVEKDDLRSAETINDAVTKGLEKYPGPLAPL